MSIWPGPGRQRELPAGFFEAAPERDRLTASRKRIFGGFEDKSGADRAKNVGGVSLAIPNRVGAVTSDGFVPRSTVRFNFRSSWPLGKFRRALRQFVNN